MPGISHEGPVELLRRNPRLAAALLAGTGVAVPAEGAAVMAAADLSSALPAELRADAVVVLAGRAAKLAVVVEVQLARRRDKHRVWPAYLALARAQHDCPTVLLVICPDRVTGRWARRPIATGHPGFDLVPLVIDADSTPAPDDPGLTWAAPELAVLAALTGAADLDHDDARRLVLNAIAAADLDEDRLETYTRLVRAAASAAARRALEALMTTLFKDEFVDRIKAEGRAEGEAEGRAQGAASMVLRILGARGFEVPGPVRDRVLSCTDPEQLEDWGGKAVTAASLEEVFAGDQ
jgi:hypothetical protein